MKYKKGDKVVVEVDEVDASYLNKGRDPNFYHDQVLGKLEDFQTAEKKIKMSVEEKKEFDELVKRVSHYYSINVYKTICTLVESNNYPALNARVASSFEKQMELLECIRKPSLIEVEKEKKYYVHLLEGDLGYLNYNKTSKEFFINSKEADGNYKVKFTKPEITKMHFDNFKLTDDALEEV